MAVRARRGPWQRRETEQEQPRKSQECGAGTSKGEGER